MFVSGDTGSGFDFARFFEAVASFGYAGVEIAPFTIDTNAAGIPVSKRDEIRTSAEKFGLEITGLHWLLAKTEGGFYMTSPEPEIRKKTLAYFGELVRLCADLGGKVMVCGSPQQRSLLPGVTLDQANDYAYELFSELVPMLDKHGVVFAFEPLSLQETDFLTTAEETVRLIERIDAPGLVELHLDCKAMASEKLEIPDIIRNNKKHLVYFHVNDPNLRAPGFGDLDFEPILLALKEIGYEGWLSLEAFDMTPGAELMARESIQYLENILNKLAYNFPVDPKTFNA